MPFFKNVFRSKDGPRSKSAAGKYADEPVAQPKPRWEDAWSRKDVAPEEIQELIHVCTQEMKSRALDMPFLLLPFRPAADPSAARNFVRSFFRASYEGSRQYSGQGLQQELRLVEPLVLCSILKWCWGRLPGGVVTWDAYELFRIGESDSNFARHAFDTFIPLSVESESRKQIIFSFFDLLAAVAARGKTNGMGGRKLSRMAGWWAFEHSDDGKGFDGGYRAWAKAADASSHLFFAYLRTLSPEAEALGGISALPRSLQALLSQTEYPPQTPELMQTTTTKVVMIVDSVSPTPFALLRRAKHFEYRDDDEALQQFSAYEDTVKALTDECVRVLHAISSTNQSSAAVEGVKQDASWSRFEDLGFSGLTDGSSSTTNGASGMNGTREFSSMRPGPRSRNNDFGRPTTPSWADFLSSGFADENGQTSPAPFLLPPDKILLPIGEAARVQSSQSHIRGGLQVPDNLEPGELASITQFNLDDTFWWVWMTSLAAEEPTERKAVFGRCALVETRIRGAKWLVMEEQVKGASPGPEEGAYIAEKKGRFSFRKTLGRRKSTGKKAAPATIKEPYNRTTSNTPMSKTSIGPDQHARIQAAAARLAQNQKNKEAAEQFAQRRARMDDAASTKTNSVLTLQPHLVSEAGPAMKWDKKFGEGAMDKDAIRAKYLGDVNAGRGGSSNNLLRTANGGASMISKNMSNRDLPALPKDEVDAESTRRDVPPSPAPPAPLPITPSPAAVHSQLAEASSAARVPLPALSPLALDEKPSSQANDWETHPAFRQQQQVPGRKPVAPAVPTHETYPEEETAPTPEPTKEPAKKSPPKKLKKKDGGGGGGFRKLFGKKKADAPAPTEPTHFEPEAPVASGRYTPQTEREPSPPPEPAPAYSEERYEPVQFEPVPRSPQLGPSPAVSSHGQRQRDAPLPAPPSANTYDQREADQAFARFDQGPMDDMPAFVPDDSEDEEDLAAPSVPLHRYQTHDQSRDVVTPTQRDASAMDDASEESIDLSRQQSPSQDRWAQIRRNAAERAARLSEEQSRRSQSQSARTDEGETSGEETIESRVARIKARVAELTGNVDGQSTPPRRPVA